jgi:integrase
MPKVKQKNGIKRSVSGFYSFRKQVPEKLRELWGKREVKVKLETKDEATALNRGAMLLAEFNSNEARLLKQLENPDTLTPREITQVADARVRQWGGHPDQAPVLKAGASDEEYKAFREAEADYLEQREIFWDTVDLVDEAQRKRDYDSGVWGQPGYQDPTRKLDLSKVEDVTMLVVAGDVNTTSEPTLRTATEDYIADYLERNVDGNPRTIQNNNNNTRRLMSQFAAFIEGGRSSAGMERLVTSIGVNEAILFRTWLRDKHPNSSTADSYLRYPSAVFSFVIERGQGLFIDGHLMRNPFYKLRNKKRENKYSKKIWPLTPAEFAQFEKAAFKAPEQIKLLVLFLLYTGCRISDVSGLQVRDINLTENIPTIYLRDNEIRRLDKNGLRSNIPLVGPLLEELRKYQPPENYRDAFLPQFGRLKSYRDRAQQEASKVLRAAKVVREGVRPHSARHTWQDRLDAARVPISERDYLLAHKTEQSSAIAMAYGTSYPPKNMLENQLAALGCLEWGDFRDLY